MPKTETRPLRTIVTRDAAGDWLDCGHLAVDRTGEGLARTTYRRRCGECPSTRKLYRVHCWQKVMRYHTVLVRAKNNDEACELGRDKMNDHSGPFEDEEVIEDGVEDVQEYP